MNTVFGIKPRHRVVITITMLVIFLSAIGVFAYSGAFARYMADDFCTAYELNHNGFVTSQINWYTGWTGRFSFTAAVNLVELLGPGVAPLLPPLTLIFWFGLLTWTTLQFNLLFLHKRHLLASFLLAAVFLYVFLESVPNIGQVLYWQTGMLTYLAPLVAATLVFGILAHVAQPRQPMPHKAIIGWSVVLGLVTFIWGGFSDTFAALQVSFLTLAVFFSYLFLPRPRRQTVFILLLAALGGALLALILVTAAPGNARRESYFPPHPGIFEVIQISTVRATGIIYYWTTEHTISVLIILIFPALIIAMLHRARLTAGQMLDDAITARLLVAIPLLAFLLTVAAFAPVTWGITIQPPDRMLAIPMFVLVCAAIAWSGVVGWAVGQAAPMPMPMPLASRRSILIMGGSVLLALLVIGPMQTAVVVHARIPLMKQYAKQWDQRDQQLRADVAAGKTTAEVDWMGSIVGLMEVQTEPNRDTNRCVASYYGLQTVTARPGSE